jgi:hypothetical protein
MSVNVRMKPRQDDSGIIDILDQFGAVLSSIAPGSEGSGISDGTYGDITVSGGGTVLTVVSLTIENRTSDPGSPAAGRIWLRTDL